MRLQLSWVLVTVVAMASCRDVDVPAPQVGSVQGTFMAKAAPMEGLALVLTPETGNALAATTAGDGTFHLDGLRPGVWVLNASATGYVPFERTFSVVNGQTRDLGTLTLFAEAADDAAGTVTGTVKVAGAASNEVQGATIEALLQPDSRLLATTAVGASGLFALQVPPGTYTLRVTHPFFVTASTMGVQVATKAQVALADDALIMQLNPGRVTGRVLREVEGQPAPVPAANVIVSSDTGASTTTAMDGTYALGGLPGGARILRFALTDYHPTFDSLSVMVTAGADTAAADVEMYLDRGGVEGEVEMGDNSPLRDVQVFIDGTPYSASAVPSTTTPSKGTFSITGVPVGDYSLRAERTGYRRVTSGTFHVSANRQTQLPALARLTRSQGAFGIEDPDVQNTPGFTRTGSVLLVVNDTSGVADWRAGETDPSVAGLAFQPFGADGGTAIAFTLSPSDGEKTVFLQLRDSMGIAGPVLTASIVLDTTPPTDVTLRIGDGSGFIAQTDPLPFTLTARDPGISPSGLAFMRLGTSVDGMGQVTTSRRTYQRDDVFTRGSMTQGPVTLYAQLIDNAGNASVASSVMVVVDTLAPAGTITVQQGSGATKAGYTSQPAVTLNVSATAEPNGGQVRVRLGNSVTELDTATPQAVTAAMTGFLDQSSDGLKTVWYRFVDSAGNLSAPASATITLDRVPPAPLAPALVLASLSSASVTSALGGQFTATASDDRELSPTAAVQLEVDGLLSAATPPTSTTTVTGSLPFTLPGIDGLHTVRVLFKDAAGNVASTALSTITLDRAAPTGRFSLAGRTADGQPVSSDTSGAIVSDPVVRIDVLQEGATGIYASTAAIANCAAVSAGSFVAPGAASLTTFNLGTNAGVATVAVCLRDAAGNTASLGSASLTVDTSTPSGCALQLPGAGINGVTPPVGTTASRGVVATLSGCSEAPRDIALVESGSALTCTPMASLPWAPISTLAALQLGSDGLHTFQACVRDAAKNVGSVTSASITLDTTAPTGATLVINAGAAFVNASQVTSGQITASLTGQALGAVDWAVGTSAAPSNYAAFVAGSPRNLPSVTVVDGTPLRLFARFRDAVGNVADATATIDVDTSAPPLPTLSVRPTAGVAGFINSEAATVVVTALQAASFKLAEGADLATCTANLGPTDLQSVQGSYTLIIPGADGVHTLCGQSRDAAGNPSVVASTTVTLDRVVPALPQMLSDDSYGPPKFGANVYLDTIHIRNVVDPQHQSWRYVGGNQTTPLVVTPGAAVTYKGVSALPLGVWVLNYGGETGDINTFSVTEIDKAGNESPAARVTIVVDGNAPEPVVLRQDWINNGATGGIFHWTLSTSPDVDHYELYYGSAPGDRTNPANSYFGTFASQGPSPLLLPSTTSTLSLTGLPPGALTFVTLVPVDRAGNRGPTPGADGGLAELQLEPNDVSADRIAEVYLFPDAGHPTAGTALLIDAPSLVGSNDLLWAAGQSTQNHLVLTSVATAGISTATAMGFYGSAVPPVPQTPTVWTDQAVSPYQVAVRLEYPWLFTISGSHIRIFSVATRTPVLVSDLDCRAPTFANPVGLTALEVRGNNLFAAGYMAASATDVLIHVDVSSLYDNVAGGPAFPGALKAVVQNFNSTPTQLLWTRDRMSTTLSSGHTAAFDLTNALDASGATNISLADRFSFAVNLSASRFQPIQAGDLSLVSTGSVLGAVGIVSAAGMSTLWAKSGSYFPEFGRSTFGSLGQAELLGPQYFYGAAGSSMSPSRFSSGDFSTPSAPVLTGETRATAPGLGSGVAVLGNFGFTATGTSGSNSAVLHAWEIANPIALHQRTSFQYPMGVPHVEPGFVVGSSGQVFDMLAGPVPVRRQTPATLVEACAYDSILVDDTLVGVRTADFRVTRLDESHGRIAVPGTVTSASSTFNPPVAEKPTGIDRVGNYAVVVAARATVPTSLWVEVYRLSGLRSQATNQARNLVSADKLGEYQFDTTGGAAGNSSMRVRVTNGIAVVVRNSTFAATEAGAWMLDINPLLDDNPGTAMGTNQVVGRFVANSNFQVSDGVLSGTTLYLAATGATKAGLYTFDASAAFDADPATKVSYGDMLVDPILNVVGPVAIDVHGVHLLMLASRTGTLEPTLFAFNVQTPDEPFLIGQAPAPAMGSNANCSSAWSGISVAGGRAYIGTPNRFDVYDLE